MTGLVIFAILYTSLTACVSYYYYNIGYDQGQTNGVDFMTAVVAKYEPEALKRIHRKMKVLNGKANA